MKRYSAKLPALFVALPLALTACGGGNQERNDTSDESSTDEETTSSDDADSTATTTSDDQSGSETTTEDPSGSDTNSTSSSSDDPTSSGEESTSTGEDTESTTDSSSSGETTADGDGDKGEFVEGIVLDGVEVNQAVATNVAEGGVPLERDKYIVQLVGGRKALVRALYTLEDSWKPAEVEARLTLKHADGKVEVLVDNRMISEAPDLTKIDGTFNWTLKPEQVTGDMQYSVGLFVPDSDDATPPPMPPRIPAEVGTYADLGVPKLDQPMRFEVVIVTVDNGETPDITEERKQLLRDAIFELNPVAEAEVTFREEVVQVTAASADMQLSDCLGVMRSARNADGAGPHEYYIGLLAGSLSGLSALAGGGMDEADQRVSCTFIDDFRRLAMFFVTHELGHAEGSAHTPGCGAAGTVSDFPHLEGGAAKLGYQGYSIVTDSLYDASGFDDVMNYCDPQWISDYTYNNWTETLASLSTWPQYSEDPLNRPAKTEVLYAIKAPSGRISWSISPGTIPASAPLLAGASASFGDRSLGRTAELPVYSIRMGHEEYQSISIPLHTDINSVGPISVHAFGETFTFDNPRSLRAVYEKELARKRK